MTTAGQGQPGIVLLGQAVDALGGAGFCPALTAWLQSVTPYSFTVVFGYMGERRPLDIHDDFPPSRRRVFVSDYQEGPYLLDPFCLSALRPVPPGLYRLKTLAPDRFYQGEYFRTYYQRTEIAEEIGYFAQMPGDCHVVLSLMREERVFSQPEFRRLAALAPLVTALMRRQWAGLAQDFAACDSDRPEPAGEALERLTPREREIVAYVLKGYSAEATGQALGIATGTVRIHRRNIYAKLGISSQRELFARFLASMG
ncbi:LuxR C-terminal-related transcriptional regulator [Paracoccus sp. (in: a-proteobacteria)]|uniref:helix-turn-helix transcriptional regulator n=1 Tax=Paracoccus sp. TaxID=267 RepID=UPI0032204585